MDFAEFMKMMAKNGPNTASEIKETFAIFNSSGSYVTFMMLVASRHQW